MLEVKQPWLKKPREVLIWLLSSVSYINLLEVPREFSLLSSEKHPPQIQLPSVSPSVKQEFCSVSRAVNKKRPLKLGMCLRVHGEVGFPSHRLNTIQTWRRGIDLRHFPGYNSITCLMEFPSYSLTAKTKPNKQVLLINHADDLQELFFFYIRNLYWVWFSAYWSFFLCKLQRRHPKDILSIYALSIQCAYISICVYAKVINDQYQQ